MNKIRLSKERLTIVQKKIRILNKYTLKLDDDSLLEELEKNITIDPLKNGETYLWFLLLNVLDNHIQFAKKNINEGKAIKFYIGTLKNFNSEIYDKLKSLETKLEFLEDELT